MPMPKIEIEKCPKCDKAVYANEARLAGGHKWHSTCFRCYMCNKALDSTNASPHENEVFCRQCHGRKYGPKGYGFGGGAGALSMDVGSQHGGSGDSASNKPTNLGVGPPAGGKKIAPEDGGCPRCGGRVYDAEATKGAGFSWHKVCFKCKNCNKSLDSTTCCVKGSEIYDKNCYAKLFGPGGKI